MDSSQDCWSCPSIKNMIYMVTLIYSWQPLFTLQNGNINWIKSHKNTNTKTAFPQPQNLTLPLLVQVLCCCAALTLLRLKTVDPAVVNKSGHCPDPHGEGHREHLK